VCARPLRPHDRGGKFRAAAGCGRGSKKDGEGSFEDDSPKVSNFDRASGTFTVYAAMLFKDCVFKTKMEVSSNGLIQIVEHELALGGLTPEESKKAAATGLN